VKGCHWRTNPNNGMTAWIFKPCKGGFSPLVLPLKGLKTTLTLVNRGRPSLCLAAAGYWVGQDWLFDTFF